MKIKLIISIFVLAATSAFAQNSEKIIVNVNDLPPELVAEIKNKQKIESVQRQIETVGKFTGMGEEIGTAVEKSLGALTEKTAEFAKTKVGKFTMVLVAYKVLGEDFFGFVVGIPLLLFLCSGTALSYYLRAIPRRKRIKGKPFSDDAEYEIINNLDKDCNDYQDLFSHFTGVFIMHGVMMLISVFVCCLIMFG